MKYNITNNSRVSSTVPEKEAAKLIVTTAVNTKKVTLYEAIS